MFRSLVDLQAAINRFLAETNDHPKPFLWTADPDKIIAAVRRGYQTLESIHSLMSAFPSSRRVNLWLPWKRLVQALPGRAGGAVVETTVDHTLMRGSEPHDR